MAEMDLICKSCGQAKPLTEFYSRQVICKLCHNKKSKEYVRKEDPVKRAKLLRSGKLKREYGLSTAQYDEMLKKQGGVCAICFQPEAIVGQPLAVDHNHQTGQIRGLLCRKCNSILGTANDDITRLRSAIVYLGR